MTFRPSAGDFLRGIDARRGTSKMVTEVSSERRITGRGKWREGRIDDHRRRSEIYFTRVTIKKPEPRTRSRHRASGVQPLWGGHGTLHLDLRFSFLSHLRQDEREGERRRRTKGTRNKIDARGTPRRRGRWTRSHLRGTKTC